MARSTLLLMMWVALLAASLATANGAVDGGARLERLGARSRLTWKGGRTLKTAYRTRKLQGLVDVQPDVNAKPHVTIGDRDLSLSRRLQGASAGVDPGPDGVKLRVAPSDLIARQDHGVGRRLQGDAGASVVESEPQVGRRLSHLTDGTTAGVLGRRLQDAPVVVTSCLVGPNCGGRRRRSTA